MEGDSFQERASPTVALMKEYLKGRGCNIDDFPYSQMDGFRKQNNGVDCGAFVLKAIEHLYHGQPLNFGPTDIHEFRLQLCERFLRGEFGD
ncbi:putative ubiquitin-like-specific protease 1B [Tasmannia lanceolata]|uniref:putative ubiquitin-like-specific protease 1B n=1 Tax=Tasmannia lanceolata TaxID=3420 RepID=UPI00406453C1